MRLLPKPEARARIDAERTDGCVMCQMATRAPRLAENDVAVAVLAPYAVRKGHALVILRRHEESNERLTREEWRGLGDLSWVVMNALTRALSPVRTYVASLGSTTPRPMSFPHPHQHVVPIYDGGEIDRPAEVFTWQNGVWIFEDGELEPFVQRLQLAL